MRLRADDGELDEVLSDWWQEFSLADDNLRRDMVDEVRLEQQQRPKVARVPRTTAPRPATPLVGSAEVASGDSAATADGVGDVAPKKRRRRRRSSGAGDAGGQAPSTGD